MDEREGSSRAILTNSGFEGYVFVELDEGMFLEDVVVAIGDWGVMRKSCGIKIGGNTASAVLIAIGSSGCLRRCCWICDLVHK